VSTGQSIIIGMAGAAVPEAMRVVALLRTGRLPTMFEWIATAILILLGVGVYFFDTTADSKLEVAVLGASFPQLFSGLVATTTASSRQKGAFRSPGKSADPRTRLIDYVSWRLS
jgi:hypothetical protein